MLPPLPRCSSRASSSLILAQPYQPSPIPLSGRPAHRRFRGLLGVHSRCGLHTRTVTKLVTAIRGLQTFRRLHACPVASGGSGRRAGLAPAGKAPPCHGARGQRLFPNCSARDTANPKVDLHRSAARSSGSGSCSPRPIAIRRPDSNSFWCSGLRSCWVISTWARPACG